MFNTIAPEDFYHFSGSLPPNADSYITRKADNELYKNAKAGKFCYVLSSRQIGKTSLKLKVIEKLKKRGIQCIAIDMSAIRTSNIDKEKWYYSIILNITREINQTKSLGSWWSKNQHLDAGNKFVTYLEEFVLPKVDSRLIIFIDEIDSIVSAKSEKFSTRDFFFQLANLVKLTKGNEIFGKLNFVVLGVSSSFELAGSNNAEPFSSGKEIKLDNFTYRSAKKLIKGFKKIKTDKKALLKEILEWTGGQPILTQRLCYSIATSESAFENIAETVEKHVNKLFLSETTARGDTNLSNIHNRIVNNITYKARMLALYKKILHKGKIGFNKSDKAHQYLLLSGLVIEKHGSLQPSNKIYTTKFNLKWANSVN